MPTRYPLSIHLVIDNFGKMLSSTCKKGLKDILGIISKPRAYLQTMTKTPVNFQKNGYKTVGGIAPTKVSPVHSLSFIIFDIWLSSTCKKVTK